MCHLSELAWPAFGEEVFWGTMLAEVLAFLDGKHRINGCAEAPTIAVNVYDLDLMPTFFSGS